MKHFLFFTFLVFTVSCLSAQKVNNDILTGNEAYRKGAFAEAATNYEQALKIDGNNPIAIFNLANAIYKQNQYASALTHYIQIIQQTTDKSLRAKAWYNMGNAYIRQQKINDAIQAYRQSLLLAPEDNDARENLQKAMQEKSRQDKQKQQPNKSPESKQAKNPLNPALAEQYMQQLREQEKQLQKQLQKSPTTGQRDKDW